MNAKEFKHAPNTNPAPTYPRPPMPPPPPQRKATCERAFFPAFFSGIKELAADLRDWRARNPRPIPSPPNPLPPATPTPTMRYADKEPKV